VRLDKYLSHCTSLSRKDSRREIRAGSVYVNGKLTRDSSYAVDSADTVAFKENVIALPKPRYFMVHKPLGVVSASSDADNPCVTDLLGDHAPGLQVAGRLDKNASGLVLLSDDGDWIHHVIAPAKNCVKTYYVEVDKKLPEDAEQQFAEGVVLKAEHKPTLPALLQPLDELTYRVKVSEGRYHQVKRMFAACGSHVTKLHREQIGAICLDQSLSPGQYRALTTGEIGSVISR
jgi:16S rRNA pseudouridine516 synthase